MNPSVPIRSDRPPNGSLFVMTPMPRHLLRLAGILLLLLSISGCTRPLPSDKPSDKGTVRWELIEMNGHPVGYQRIERRVELERARAVERIHGDATFVVQRFGQRTEQRIILDTRSDRSGRLISLECRVNGGQASQRSVGVVREGEIHWMSYHDGHVAHQWKSPLADTAGGFFAVEQSLRIAPMEPGQQRRLQGVLPIVNQVANIELTAGAYETTRLLPQSRQLLKITSRTLLGDGTAIESTLWSDQRGRIWKTEFPQLGQVTYRVSGRDAIPFERVGRYDLGHIAQIPLSSPLRDVTHATRAVYRLSLSSPRAGRQAIDTPLTDRTTPLDRLPTTAWQQVLRLDDGSVRVTVLDPTTGTPFPEGRAPPREDDLATSPLIQTDDPLVLQLARRIRVGEDKKDQARQVAIWVGRHVRNKEFSTAFGSAADVARSRAGDCTEHAVLVAAIGRALEMPTRICVGLVYDPQPPRMVFHMWNTTWIGDRWLPIDATRPDGRVRAGHLTVIETDLSTDNGLTAIMPVMQLLGRLRVQVTRVTSRQRPVAAEPLPNTWKKP